MRRERIRQEPGADRASRHGRLQSLGIRTGEGTPLDPALRMALEPTFATDFSQVRVHADAHAARLARERDAHAFTVGHDVFFGDNRYQPSTLEGTHLIAHELTHVVQQRHGSPGSDQAPQHPVAEQEAGDAATNAMIGAPVSVEVSAPVAPALQPATAGFDPMKLMMQAMHMGGGEAKGGEGKEGGEGPELGMPAPIELGNLLYQGATHEMLPGMKAFEPIGKALSPLQLMGGLGDLGSAFFGDGSTEERVDKGVTGGLKTIAGGTGTAGLMGLLPEVPVWASGGTIAELGGGAMATSAGMVAGSGLAGYETGKLALGAANSYAKNNDIFGKDDTGEVRDSTDAAADAGIWVQNKLHSKYLPDAVGDVAGGITSVGASIGTAAYSGLHALGSGIKSLFTSDGPSDAELAAGEAQVTAGMEQTLDDQDRREMEQELYGN